MDLNINWKPRRIDESGDPGPPLGEGLIEIDARIVVDGAEAGTTDGFYLLAEEPASMAAFFEFWDMEQWICEIYGELVASPKRECFREPLPRLLEAAPGILFIRLTALAPAFRGKGIGRAVFQRWLDDWCNAQVGAVLLHAEPLQRRPGAYDHHDDEIRDLPWESPEEDRDRLRQHLRGWGLHHIAGTRFMVATPHGLGVVPAESWPPVEFEECEPEDLDDFDEGEDIPF